MCLVLSGVIFSQLGFARTGSTLAADCARKLDPAEATAPVIEPDTVPQAPPRQDPAPGKRPDRPVPRRQPGTRPNETDVPQMLDPWVVQTPQPEVWGVLEQFPDNLLGLVKRASNQEWKELPGVLGTKIKERGTGSILSPLGEFASHANKILSEATKTIKKIEQNPAVPSRVISWVKDILRRTFGSDIADRIYVSLTGVPKRTAREQLNTHAELREGLEGFLSDKPASGFAPLTPDELKFYTYRAMIFNTFVQGGAWEIMRHEVAENNGALGDLPPELHPLYRQYYYSYRAYVQYLANADYLKKSSSTTRTELHGVSNILVKPGTETTEQQEEVLSAALEKGYAAGINGIILLHEGGKTSLKLALSKYLLTRTELNQKDIDAIDQVTNSKLAEAIQFVYGPPLYQRFMFNLERIAELMHYEDRNTLAFRFRLFEDICSLISTPAAFSEAIELLSRPESMPITQEEVVWLGATLEGKI